MNKNNDRDHTKSRKYMQLAIAVAGLTAASSSTATSQGSSILDYVETQSPEIKIDRIDRDRLTVRRIDIVDEHGVIRMTLAGKLPNPVVDGVQYKRAFEVGGIMLRDDQGNERGGFAFNKGIGGPLIALDHPDSEAAGFALRPDGTVLMVLVQAPKHEYSKELGGAMIPSSDSTLASIEARVSPEGKTSFALTDQIGRERIRLRVHKDGYGMIEFLDADGTIVKTIAPELEGVK